MRDQGDGAVERETRRGEILSSVRKFNALVDCVSGVSVERDFTVWLWTSARWTTCGSGYYNKPVLWNL